MKHRRPREGEKEVETQTQPKQSSDFNVVILGVFLPCQVSKGLYRLLIDLCILRHIHSPDGLVWQFKPSHLYLIEYLAKGKGVSSTKKREVFWGSVLGWRNR